MHWLINSFLYQYEGLAGFESMQAIKLPWKQFYCIIYDRDGLQPSKHTKIVIAFICARVLNVMFRIEMIISNKQLTKKPIKLCECADWSAPLLFAQP